MNRPRLHALLLSVAALSPSLVSFAAAQDQRPGALDMILLIDKSLSMAPFFQDVKIYAAQKVLEPILVPGDRLVIETFYGRVDRLFAGTIATEEDKAKAIRAVGAVKADGAFTDLGAALDKAKMDLDEFGQPERPKYVLMLTDERQEAPKGSPYQAPDHKLKHPSLTYIKKVDLGKFRAITVGIEVGAKVEEAAPDVMKFITEPSAGSSGVGGQAFPPASQQGLPGDGLQGDKAQKNTPQKDKAAHAQGTAAEAGTTAPERALPPWLLEAAAALLFLALAGLSIALIVSKNRKKEREPR